MSWANLSPCEKNDTKSRRQKIAKQYSKIFISNKHNCIYWLNISTNTREMRAIFVLVVVFVVVVVVVCLFLCLFDCFSCPLRMMLLILTRSLYIPKLNG